jgi:ABC-type lipoprotein export system ATPase subunit
MIRIRGMQKSYSTGKVVTEVLRGVDLDIEDGEFISVIGPSGSGKSTLLHAIGGLDSDYKGSIEVDGKDLAKLSDAQLSAYRNETVGFVFQSFYLLPHLTCLENITLPAVFKRGSEMDEAAATARAKAVLEQVDLLEKADALPTMLSGGQRQRIAIARALFNKPKIMLCDEPTGNLDSKMGAAIIDLFRKLNEDDGITVLIVTHDPGIASSTPRQLLVADGALTDEATPAAEAQA